MDKIWDITIDFLAKINTWIPLVSILWAGAGLVGIVLILAITGCALRKRLVPQWLIWGYFIFAAMIIFAQANNDIFTVVAYMEIPFLIVLVCYFLRMLFYRRPRYTYVERTVQVREVSKNRDVKNVNKEVVIADQVQTSVLNEEDDEDDNQVNIDETIAEVKAEASEENTITEVVADKAEVEEESVEDSVIENVDTEESIVSEVETANDVATEEENIVEPVKVAEPVTTDLPVVEPIVEKTYEAPRPTMTTTTATTAATAARPTTATSTLGRTSLGTGSLFGSRPTSSTSTTATTTTPRSTLNTASSTSSRPTLSSYSSMLGARKPAATSATSTTSTVRPTSGVGTSTTAKPRSTDDIMAAIERLRASMKKN